MTTEQPLDSRIPIPEHLYNELIEYFDDISDADGDSEGFHPNKEMQLLNELEQCKNNNP
jgi:hypothetical protein